MTGYEEKQLILEAVMETAKQYAEENNIKDPASALYQMLETNPLSLIVGQIQKNLETKGYGLSQKLHTGTRRIYVNNTDEGLGLDGR